jgi:tetratricopeptide (TPR) repeat protein
MHHFVSHTPSYMFLILLSITNTNAPVRVLSQLNQFDKAPDLVLPKLAAQTETMNLQMLDQPAILIFGEPYHQQTLESLVELRKIRDAVGLTEADLRVFLILSQTPDQEQMAQLREKEKIGVEILLDKNLKAFGDYGVTVLPSTVVIDKQGRIDLALSGVPLSFADMVEDAILLATGRITRQQRESSESAAPTVAEQESVKQAHRLASLAGQLAARDFTALALQRYREALELDGTYLQARIGMARCLVKLNLLPDAIAELQKVLQTDANHVEANLIMSQLEIMQGGDGITEGKVRLQRILTVNPDHPEANYLMGTVCEVQGETDHALNYYKKAAKRLLETSVN